MRRGGPVGRAAVCALASVGVLSFWPVRSGATAARLPSPGRLPPPPSWCASAKPTFVDAFPGRQLNRAHWNTYLTSKAVGGVPAHGDGHGGSDINPANYLDYDRPSQVRVRSGLTFTAIRRSTEAGFPWTSGVITTYGHFEFDGGCVQVRARVPTVGGAWPAIWLLPGAAARTTTDDFEIDIFEGGMVPGANAARIGSYALHYYGRQWDGTYDAGTALAAGYHLYGLRWIPGRSVAWYFDGRLVARVTSAQFPIPDEPMELILNNGVARDTTAAWHTMVNAATPPSFTMSVSSVQIYR